jgi:hypothetical protein
MFNKNLLLDLHKMQDGIGNRCRNFQRQNNILKASQKIFFNDFELFKFCFPLQIEVINDRNLINRSNNIVVGIICTILGDMNNSWMETEHYT